MTARYCGPGGNDGNSGLTWALRKLTLNGVEDSPVAAGDICYIGPGVYREQLNVDISGGNTYNAGTVSVTNGSTTVTGAGTAFLANVSAGGLFHIQFYASGADGVANGTATFTSAAGNFQAGMIGKVIQIMTRGAYGIGAVAAANSITLTDPNGLGWPAAAVGLTYTVMSGETHYEIASVTDDTHFELVRPWCGPTLTGLVYITFDAITYIGDVTGENTDGVGGIVRVTGSDNDQTGARGDIIATWGGIRNYRRFRGFWMDTSTSRCVIGNNNVHWVVEDCVFTDAYGNTAFYLLETCENWTVRRCVIWNCLYGIRLEEASFAREDRGHVFENLVIETQGWAHSIRSVRQAGFTVRNCFFQSSGGGVNVTQPFNAGQTIVVNNCSFLSCTYAVVAQAVGEITEDYNNFFLSGVARTNTAIGANSTAYAALLQPPLLKDGYQFPWWFPELSEWAQTRAIAGLFEACGDLRGFVRPVTSAKKSWGALQFTDMEQETGTVYAGSISMEISDAGRVQFKVPCTNRSTMVRVRVQREANYAGINPQMVIKQPGQADQTTVDAGAAGAWNLLEDTFTPAVDPEYFIVELVSNNTAIAGNYATYFDDLEIRGEPQDPGEFEHWMWDRQPFETLPADPLIVAGLEYRRRRLPGEVSALREQ